jgi:hypothetical protein
MTASPPMQARRVQEVWTASTDPWVDSRQRNRRPQVLGRQEVFGNLLITFFHRASELYASTA